MQPVTIALSGNHETDCPEWGDEVVIRVTDCTYYPGSHGTRFDPPEPEQIEPTAAEWDESGEPVSDDDLHEIIDRYYHEIAHRLLDAQHEAEDGWLPY